MCLGAPGRIIAITDAASFTALADVAGETRQVNIACIVDDAHPLAACIGDWVLVHSGFAMERIDEDEAQETLKLLTDMAEDATARQAALNRTLNR